MSETTATNKMARPDEIVRESAQVVIARLTEQLDELLAAAKGYRIVARPWIDKAIGRSGTVTFQEWDAACQALEAAIAKAEGLRTKR